MEKEFQRLLTLIGMRAEATQQLARFCLKATVLANSGAVIATLTFMGTSLKDGRPANLVTPLYLFLIGFLSSLGASILTFLRAYRATRAEARFLNDVMTNRAQMNWLGSPEVDTGIFGILVGVGAVLGLISFGCFVVGAIWGTISLQGFLSSLAAKK